MHNDSVITIRRNIFRALIKEHLTSQGFPGNEKELEELINMYEQVETEFVQGGVEEDV